MLLSKLNAMSIGAVWVSRAREQVPSANQLPPLIDARCCSICGEPWLQSIDEDSSIVVVSAAPITDSAQQKLLENCFRAAGWNAQSTVFSLHASCSSNTQPALLALQEFIAAQLPKHIIVFGITAAQFLNPVFVSGQIYHYAGTPLIVTHHPKEMIHTPLLKAQVWADFCLAKFGRE